MDAAVVVFDLRDHPERADSLVAFTRLYDRTFVDPAEREDPGEWPARLWNGPGEGPGLHLVVAEARECGGLLGGLAFEYFPASRSGLLTYLVSSPAARGRGVAGRLVAAATEILERSAGEQGLLAILAETEDPRHVTAEESSMDPRERLVVFHRMGFRRLEMQYAQPPLGPGQPWCEQLLLLFLRGSAAAGDAVERRAILSFLREFYASLGLPPDTPRLLEIVRTTPDPVPLRSLVEEGG